MQLVNNYFDILADPKSKYKHADLEMSEDIGWGYNDSADPYKSYVRRIINPFTYVPRP